MEKANLYGLLLSGLAGTVTSILHAIKQGVKHTWGKTLLQFSLGFAAVYVAYLIGEIFDLSREQLLVVGYLAGVLGDRVIQEIYRRENDIYSFFVGDRINKDKQAND